MQIYKLFLYVNINISNLFRNISICNIKYINRKFMYIKPLKYTHNSILCNILKNQNLS